MNKKNYRHCEARSAVAIQKKRSLYSIFSWIASHTLAMTILASALAACSVEGKNDYGSYYQKQASLDVLKMPPGISAQGADNYYVVPPGPMADVKTISILPPGSRAYQSALDKNAKNAAAATPAVAATPATTNTAEPAKQ